MRRKLRKHAGIIGLGIIGSRVAAALRAAGFRTFVWNRSPRPEPNFLGSPREVAEAAPVVQLFVPDADALFEVLAAINPALTREHTVVCSATVGPEATREAARFVAHSGAHFLDAPFTGSKQAAEERRLTYFIGGDDATLERVEPVLRASAKHLVKVGGIGDAATVKIATNMLVGVTMQTLAEAVALVKKSGLDPAVLMQALEHHAIRSGFTDMKMAGVLSGDFSPHFHLKHAFKDVQLAIQVANALGLDIPATTATAGVMYGALSRGWGDLDLSALVKVYEEIGKPEPAAAPEPEPMPELAIGPEAATAPETPTASPATAMPGPASAESPSSAATDAGADQAEAVPSSAPAPSAMASSKPLESSATHQPAAESAATPPGAPSDPVPDSEPERAPSATGNNTAEEAVPATPAPPSADQSKPPGNFIRRLFWPGGN